MENQRHIFLPLFLLLLGTSSALPDDDRRSRIVSSHQIHPTLFRPVPQAEEVVPAISYSYTVQGMQYPDSFVGLPPPPPPPPHPPPPRSPLHGSHSPVKGDYIRPSTPNIVPAIATVSYHYKPPRRVVTTTEGYSSSEENDQRFVVSSPSLSYDHEPIRVVNPPKVRPRPTQSYSAPSTTYNFPPKKDNPLTSVSYNYNYPWVAAPLPTTVRSYVSTTRRPPSEQYVLPPKYDLTPTTLYPKLIPSPPSQTYVTPKPNPSSQIYVTPLPSSPTRKTHTHLPGDDYARDTAFIIVEEADSSSFETFSRVPRPRGEPQRTGGRRLPVTQALRNRARATTLARRQKAPTSFQRTSSTSLESDDDDHHDASYSFSYTVGSPDALDNGFQGHSQTQDGKRTEGRYFVNLPDGRIQVVEYYADETGYHPTIKYV